MIKSNIFRYILIFLLCIVYQTKTFSIQIESTKIYKPKKITIASEPYYPPFCMVDKNGKAIGYSIDTFLAVAKSVNLEVDIKVGIWKQIKQDLIDGKIDALPLVGKTPEREKVFDFSLPYLTLYGAIFVNDDMHQIQSIEDLKEKKVIVMSGDVSEEYVRNNNITNKILTTDTYEEAFRKLQNKEADAVIATRVIGHHLLKELGITTITSLDIPLPEFKQDFCFAVKKGNTELLSLLNDGLYLINNSEEYDNIYKKWLSPIDRKVTDYKELITMVMYILIPLVFLFSVVSVIILRLEVKRRTKQLEQEIAEHRKTMEILKIEEQAIKEMEKITKIGYWVYDLNTKKFEWSEGVFEIFSHLRNQYNNLSKNIYKEIFHPEDNEIIEKAIDRLIQNGEPINLELRLNVSDTVQNWVKVTGHAQYDEGKITYVRGYIIDITEQKQKEESLEKSKYELEKLVSERTKELEDKVNKLLRSEKAMLYMVEDLNDITDQLRKEREKLAEANRELEAFAYSVSHDLRAPLRAIDGFSRIILDKHMNQLDTEGIRLFEEVRSNAKKMSQLIDDLLSLSRVSRAEFKQQNIDMKSLVHSIYHELTSTEQRAKINFIIQDLPDAIGDSSLIRQVWSNLISNAIKFSSKTPNPVIEVKGEINGEEIIYSIHDNGVGFNPNYKHKLFNVFQRLHLADQFEGTGVGLAIVYRIIHRHGGRVWAESELGKGASFYFTIPLSGE